MKFSKEVLLDKVKSLVRRFKGLNPQYKVILGLITVFILMGLSFWAGMVYSRGVQKAPKTSQEALDEGISNSTKKQFILGTIEEVSGKEITVRDRKKEATVIKITGDTKIDKKDELKEGRQVVVRAKVKDGIYTAETISVRPE